MRRELRTTGCGWRWRIWMQLRCAPPLPPQTGLTKLHLWNLTQFSKVVYLDADTIVLDNVDEVWKSRVAGAWCGRSAPAQCSHLALACGHEPSFVQLFSRPGAPLAAAPDLFPPDRFNAGVLVVTPDSALFAAMVAASGTLPSYDGGDTGVCACVRVCVCLRARVCVCVQ